ncbi:unnamed protein product [Brassica rapa subsp. narinosa]
MGVLHGVVIPHPFFHIKWFQTNRNTKLLFPPGRSLHLILSISHFHPSAPFHHPSTRETKNKTTSMSYI